MGTATGRVVLGAFAGAFLGLAAFWVLNQGYPSEDPQLLMAALSLGAIVGVVLGATAGHRSVSVFWLYLALIFGATSIIPWWYTQIKSAEGLHDTCLPLAWVYFNSIDRAVVLYVLLAHTLISVALAVVSTIVHNKLIARCFKKTDK